MSYALEITDKAAEDLLALIESLPSSRRADAIGGVEKALETLAANPRLAPKVILGRPTYRFEFRAGGVQHHWAATFCYSEDEKTIRITHIFRYQVPL